MNKKILGIGVLTLLVIVGIVLIPGASSLPAYAGGAPAHITAAAPGCAGGCHNMPVFCAGCHAYPYATPTPTPTPTVTPTPTPTPTPTVTPTPTPTPTPTVTPTPTPTHPVGWDNPIKQHRKFVKENGPSVCLACHSIDPSTKGQQSTPVGPSCWNCHKSKWEKYPKHK